MRKTLVLVVAVLGLLGAACVAPPGDEPSSGTLTRESDQGFWWIGQVDGEPTGWGSIELTSLGIAHDITVCLQIDVWDGEPLYESSSAWSGGECWATSLWLGQYSVGFSRLLEDYDEAEHGSLAGKWVTARAGVQLQAGQSMPLTSVRDIEVVGVALEEGCAWRSNPYPCG